jgi:hypothetical protein
MVLSELTNKELKSILRENDVRNYSKLNKKDLVKKVNQLIKAQNGGKSGKGKNGKKKYRLRGGSPKKKNNVTEPVTAPVTEPVTETVTVPVAANSVISAVNTKQTQGVNLANPLNPTNNLPTAPLQNSAVSNANKVTAPLQNSAVSNANNEKTECGGTCSIL